MADNFSLNTVIKVDTTNFDKGIKKVGKSVSGVSDSVSTLGKALGKAFAITSFAVVAKKIGDISKEFSKATANIVKGTGATGDALKDLADSVNTAMLNGVGRSADEVGEMVADLNTRLGVTGETLENLVDKFDAFSSVTNTDVNTAINTTADIMAKWNIDTEQAGALLDQLVVASQSSGASVDQLAGSLKSGQAILSQFGMSLTESLAFLSSLKKNGIETSVALTGMRTALANFSADGKDAEKAFAEISDKIKNASTNAEALQIAVETFGSRSGAEMVKVLQSGGEGAEAFALALENAGGALAKTDEASRTSQDALEDLQATLKATFFTGGGDTQLRDTIDSIARALRDIDFSSLKTEFESLGLFLQGAWKQFKELFTNIKNAIDTTGSNFGSFGDLIYDKLNRVYQIIQSFVGSISAVLKGDWGLAWDYAKLAVLKMSDYILDTLSDLANAMPKALNKVVEGLNWFIEKLNVALEKLGQDTIKLIDPLGDIDLSGMLDLDNEIKDLETKIEKATGKVANTTLNDLKKIKDGSNATTKDIVGNVGNIGESAEEAGEKAKEALDPTRTNIVKAWEATFEEIQKDADDWSDVLGTVKSELGTIANEAFTAIGESLVNGESGWANYGAVAMEALAGVLQGIGAQLSAMAVAYALTEQYAKATVAMAGATAVMVASGVMTALANKSSQVAENISSSVESLDDFKERLQDIVDGVSSIPDVFTSIATFESKIATLTYEANMKKLSADIEYMLASLSSSLGGYDLSKALKNSNYYKYMSEYNDLLAKITATQTKITNAFNNYNTELQETIDTNYSAVESYKTLLNEMESNATYASIILNTSIVALSEELTNVYSEIVESGMTIGETLVDSIIEGATKEDFLSEMKDYLKENIVKLAVYTDTFNEKLADIGSRMAQAIVQGADLTSIREELEELYDEASANAELALASLSEVFSDIGEEAEESVDDIADYLEELEALIADFETEVGGIGTDIADSLISGIADGLTNSDFLETMYNYIRKLIIQTVVYTESMQAEIEAIGEAISEGLANGFSTDSLATIRRDLSYIFYNASKQMTGIDSLLESVFSGYATGTQSATRGLHLVGEAGPELVAFKGGETVYNAGQTRTMLGNASAGSSFNVTFNNTSDTSAYTMMKQLRQFDRELKLNGVI